MGSHLQNRLRTGSQAPVRLQHAAGLPHRLPHQPGHGHEGLRDDAPAGPRHLRTDATGRPGGRAAQHHCPRPVRRRDGSHRQPLPDFQPDHAGRQRGPDRGTHDPLHLRPGPPGMERPQAAAPGFLAPGKRPRFPRLRPPDQRHPAIHAGGAGAALLPPDGSIPGHLFPPGIKKRQ